MDLKEMESGVDPESHWYYQSKKIPLIAFVKKIYSEKRIPLTLIDVGSGSGFFMHELQEAVPEMISKIWLVDIGYGDEEILAMKNQHIEKVRSLPDKIENAVIVMMDVLEHLEDDHGMLKAIREKSEGENYFFITVPAFMGLWSGHDVYLGHHRRYTLKTLRHLLDHSSFTTLHSYYFYGFIFPAVWLVRKLKNENHELSDSDMKPASPLVNGILKLICSIELPLRKLNQLGGVTCVGEGII